MRWDPDKSIVSARKTYAVVGVGTKRLKIGSARDVMGRCYDLQVASPVELVLVATCDYNIERRMHHELATHRLHGEWFCLNETVSDLIAEQMDPCHHSLATGLPTRYGRRDSRAVGDRLDVTEMDDIDAVGIDAFGVFAPHPLRPISTREDMLRRMTHGQRIRLMSELRRVHEAEAPLVSPTSRKFALAYEQMLAEKRAANG